MKVSELIEALRQYPADMRVVVRGYEQGCNEVVEVDTDLVENSNNTADWAGELNFVLCSCDYGIDVHKDGSACRKTSAETVLHLRGWNRNEDTEET